MRRELHELLAVYFATHPCIDCGESDVRCLEFDHRDGASKISEVTVLIRRNGSRQRILEEIEKCDVRCANCHRRVTAERGGHWRQEVYEQGRAESAALSLARLDRIFAAPVG